MAKHHAATVASPLVATGLDAGPDGNPLGCLRARHASASDFDVSPRSPAADPYGFGFELASLATGGAARRFSINPPLRCSTRLVEGGLDGPDEDASPCLLPTRSPPKEVGRPHARSLLRG